MTTRDQTYALIEDLVTARTGVDIAGHLAGRVRAHVDAQVARLEMDGPQDYLAAVESSRAGADAILDDLLAAVLVHETFFMRFRSQLEVLERELLPELLAQGTRKLRIWSAGCSRGPEPYTLAMIALAGAGTSSAVVDVLGTDMCSAFIEEARRGRYREGKLKDLTAGLRDRFLEMSGDGGYAVGPELKSAVRFRRHNLLDPPPETGFHVISCRNVLMYMRPADRRTALEHLSSALDPGGYLLVGHTESLRDVPDLVGTDRRFALGIYRPAGAAAPPPGREKASPTPAAGRPDAHHRDGAAARGLTAVAGPRAPLLLRLEGDYDVDRWPEKLDTLKTRLGEAIDRGRDVVLDADGATLLDQSTARLIARAVRLLESRGGRLVVRATRVSVRHWAERHSLPVDGAAHEGVGPS